MELKEKWTALVLIVLIICITLGTCFISADYSWRLVKMAEKGYNETGRVSGGYWQKAPTQGKGGVNDN